MELKGSKLAKEYLINPLFQIILLSIGFVIILVVFGQQKVKILICIFKAKPHYYSGAVSL